MLMNVILNKHVAEFTMPESRALSVSKKALQKTVCIYVLASDLVTNLFQTFHSIYKHLLNLLPSEQSAPPDPLGVMSKSQLWPGRRNEVCAGIITTPDRMRGLDDT